MVKQFNFRTSQGGNSRNDSLPNNLESMLPIWPVLPEEAMRIHAKELHSKEEYINEEVLIKR